MLRRPKRSKNEVVVPKERKDCGTNCPFHLHVEYNGKQCLYIKHRGNTTLTYVNLVT
jgi:hypothetical protein